MKIKKKMYKKILQVAIIAVIFFFLARNLYYNWGKLSGYEWHINWHLLIFSFILTIICSFLIALGWNLILRQLGGILTPRKALKIFFLSDLGRYIPGKVWSLAGKVYLCKEQGIPLAKSSASVVVQPLIQVISGGLVFLLSLAFWKNLPGVGNLLYLIFLIIPLGFILLHPLIIKKVLNLGLKIFKKDPVDLNLRYRDMLKILLLWCGLWVFSGIANYFLIISIYPLPIAQLPMIIGIFSISWVVAFLSFLTPSGLGVMEGMLTFLLSFYLPCGIATLISLLSRIWRTINDLTCVGITIKF